MTKCKKLNIHIILIFFVVAWLLIAATVSAAENEVHIPQKNEETNGLVEPKDVGEFLSNVSGDFDGLAPMFNVLLSAIFSIMFLFGIIKMIYALITKTGMVLKGSTGVLIGIPVFVVILRLFFILAFTIDSSSKITLAVTDFLTLLIKVGYFSAVGMVLIGLVMKLFHRFLEHPEYGRWSKRLYIGATSLTLLTAIMPVVLKNI